MAACSKMEKTLILSSDAGSLPGQGQTQTRKETPTHTPGHTRTALIQVEKTTAYSAMHMI